MGLLDKMFRKREDIKEKNTHIETQAKTEKRHKIDMGMNKDGSYFFQYHNSNAKLGQIYDTTRVVIKNEPKIVEESTVYECLVSWFMTNVKQGENGKLETVAFTEVIAGIDIARMKEDEEYLKFVMTRLFEKNQVETYISNSLKSEEELANILKRNPRCGAYPCGKYIGEIQIQDRKTKKNI